MCDDLWDDNDATVICKQLGYNRGSARVSAYFGEGSGLILLDNVNCNGRESSIFSCSYNVLGEHDCRHNEDSGVICYGESSKGITCVYNAKNLTVGISYFKCKKSKLVYPNLPSLVMKSLI